MEHFDIAIIGAGKTGRGFIGRLIQESGHRFLLIDKDEKLIESLASAGSYDISFFGGSRPPLTVTDFVAMTPTDPELIGCLEATRLFFVSVGGTHLDEVASWLAKIEHQRATSRTDACNVILCENAERPAERFRQAFLASMEEMDRKSEDSLFGFSESTVFCTTIEAKSHSLDILSEDYPDLPCDAAPLKPGLPIVVGLVATSGFQDFLVRKLFTYNSASAAISYLGWWKGHTVYAEAANDPDILMVLGRLYDEVGKAMCQEFGYSAEDQKKFAARSLAKFRDRTILDTIARNAREPHRKLGRSERIIGPALLIEKHGGDTAPLALTAAVALLYTDSTDAVWSRLQGEFGPEGILSKVSELPPDSPLLKRILAYHNEMKSRDRLLDRPLLD